MVAAAHRVTFADIEDLRRSHRAEAGCQIVRDSILPRGLAQPFLLDLEGERVGYAGVWTEHFPGRVMEFYLVPAARPHGDVFCRALLKTSGAVAMEAQTNLPLIHGLLLRFARDLQVEKLLFEEGPTPFDGELAPAPGVHFRSRREDDEGPEGQWVLEREANGLVVAAGGFMMHYNPPYCDIYMEVIVEERLRGDGGYIVQELRREARAQGLIPAARCDPVNKGSRGALRKGGLVECGRIVTGPVRPDGGFVGES